ncbi:globin domain-containing protein [Aliiruegeria sabulilitoris]|uniref:globin domain-containing protein n=1 Tax=Aliiruegeria sabulilitoris TaxID=1510458 RepID=UPI0008367F4A|nr:globin domain-containing protein [Aliiruegeria sabulilitoris]NDR59576.1 globin [Pseudoruegeria sp. M32A2M]
MPPSAQVIKSVRESFDELRPYLEPTSLQFYEALFERAPELRGLFREDLRAQGMRFMNTLGLILADMEHPGEPSVDYAELGKLHSTLGIHKTHFEPMQEALIDTLRATTGERLTPELEAAWRESFAAFADKLIAAGNIPD